MPRTKHLDPEIEIAVELPAPPPLLGPTPRNGASAFDRMEDLIGCVSGGPPDLSEQTGKKFRQLLLQTVHDPH